MRSRHGPRRENAWLACGNSSPTDFTFPPTHGGSMTNRLISLALISALMVLAPAMARADWFPYKAEATDPPFSADGKRTDIEYTPLAKAAKKWQICVSFPHMKDAYWLGVDYGVVEEAKRLDVKLQLVEAGGYTNLNKQISQIEDCVARGANAVVIGAISADGLNSLIKTLAAKKVPVIDLVNGISSPEITAKSLVSFYTMGQSTGSFLAKKHPAGSPKVKVAWFPGPAGAGWVEAANKGFMEAVKGSAVDALDPKYGDTGKEAQSKLIEDALQANPDVAYIAGTAVTAEAAVGLVRSRNLQDKVKLLSFYMAPGVYEGIQKGRILASPADSMVIQGRIAIDQAVRALEGKELTKHVGPKIFVVDSSNIKSLKLGDILPPPGFKPLFEVK
ncbi:MAG: TMAO reductase system periplasmic protein TorT [Burkholderiales bacterium]